MHAYFSFNGLITWMRPRDLVISWSRSWEGGGGGGGAKSLRVLTWEAEERITA